MCTSTDDGGEPMTPEKHLRSLLDILKERYPDTLLIAINLDVTTSKYFPSKYWLHIGSNMYSFESIQQLTSFVMFNPEQQSETLMFSDFEKECPNDR
jgi:hypothetical protein